MRYEEEKGYEVYLQDTICRVRGRETSTIQRQKNTNDPRGKNKKANTLYTRSIPRMTNIRFLTCSETVIEHHVEHVTTRLVDQSLDEQ